MFRSTISLAALAIAFLPPPAWAQSSVNGSAAEAAGADSAAAPEPGSASKAHHEGAEQITVTGVRRKTADALGGVTVLDQARLTREVRTSIGETLARQPGVSATSFGPTASAPVLRGLTGDRVRILTDGIGTLDLSGSGPDHAISINPVTAERIEVLRGPAALLFGSSAIGGVVNVIDTRIPRRLPDNSVGVNFLLGYGSAADERLANGALDVPLAGRFVLHVDANWAKSGDLRTGGHILSEELRRQALASPDPDVRALAGLKGELPNSASESKEGALGFAYVAGDGLNLGVSVTRHEQQYQVPVRYSLDPTIEAEAPTIDQEQTRYDARAEVPLGGFFSHIRARGGFSDYHHDEIEETGEVGSSFFSKGGEGRVELVQRERSGWGGTSGVQYLQRNARIRGEEKFLPDSEQRQAGLFTVQTFVTGPWRLEGGARVESSKLTADDDAQLDTPSRRRQFTTVSGSVGGQYEISPGWRAGLSLSHAERAPSIDELFAHGPHGGSASFEIGDPGLEPEKSNSAEISLRHTTGALTLTANAYYSRFSNFIFSGPTGAIEDDLPVFQTAGGKATLYGFEGQAIARFGQAIGIDWAGELQADYVHATIRGFGPAPFMPPLRATAAVTGERGPFDGRLEVEHAFAQHRTASVETDTDGYTLLNAALDWHPFEKNPALSFALQGNNLLDVEARRSTSQLKDFAPLAGRDIRLTARLGL